MTARLSSVSAVLPACNDGGTIASMVLLVLDTLAQVTADCEVIVVDDGSRDYTPAILAMLGARYPALRVITHAENRGYGAALRAGFGAATKEWIFYTDGDAQYDARELLLLAQSAATADIVNGYKIARHDPLYRIALGRAYHLLVSTLFALPVRDVDCDFRLFRRALLERVQLTSVSGTIALELVFKFQRCGARFAEVPVHHFHRVYGRSQFFNPRWVGRTIRQLLAMWLQLVVRSSARTSDSP
jgi:glycosyltransferase involved in cell wall biosynthesis